MSIGGEKIQLMVVDQISVWVEKGKCFIFG